MRLDLLSMILGGVLWEISAAYLHFVAKPALKRWKMKWGKSNIIPFHQENPMDYKSTEMGYRCVV